MESQICTTWTAVLFVTGSLYNLFIRWLKKYGILTEGEKSLRKQGQLIIGDNLLSEKLPFLFNDNVNGGKVVKSAACVSTKSLQNKIIDQLEKYDQYVTFNSG